MVSLGLTDDLRQRRIQCVHIEDRQFVLVYLDNEFYLLDNRCPHKDASLCDGHVLGDTIKCPWHEAEFNVKTGRGLTPLAGKGVKSWPVLISDGHLMADII